MGCVLGLSLSWSLSLYGPTDAAAYVVQFPDADVPMCSPGETLELGIGHFDEARGGGFSTPEEAAKGYWESVKAGRSRLLASAPQTTRNELAELTRPVETLPTFEPSNDDSGVYVQVFDPSSGRIQARFGMRTLTDETFRVESTAVCSGLVTTDASRLEKLLAESRS